MLSSLCALGSYPPYIHKVTGDEVKLQTPGTYTVTYNCVDMHSNAAATRTRTIVVRDTVAPKLTLVGGDEKIEAGFKYTDAGAIATDSFDGPIKYTVDGDTVDTTNAFYSRRSCKQIKAEYTAAKTGEYFITIWSGAKYTRTSVWCDMDSLYQGKQVGFTYFDIYSLYTNTVYMFICL